MPSPAAAICDYLVDYGDLIPRVAKASVAASPTTSHGAVSVEDSSGRPAAGATSGVMAVILKDLDNRREPRGDRDDGRGLPVVKARRRGSQAGLAEMNLDEKTKEILKTWPLTTVRRWAASPNVFTLDFGDYQVTSLANC